MLSVLITVYEKENAAHFRESLQSICVQTLAADEVVLVKDGELTLSLEKVIAEYSRVLPLRTISLQRSGCWGALREGVAACRGDIVARMDSDDICLPQRFAKQMKAMAAHPQIDVVGTAIAEFMEDPSETQSVRRLPTEHAQIAAHAKRRNPINHMSAMFRRDAVLRAGNYRHSPGFEDWHLWNRMIQAGSRFMNLDEVLVLVRVGNGMFRRRSGLEYVRQEIAFHRDMYRSKCLSSGELLRSLIVRIPVRLAPEIVLRTVYVKALRSEV